MVTLIVDDDPTFRLALPAIVLLAFPVAVHHRLRAHAIREPLDRRQEGLFILLTLRPVAARGGRPIHGLRAI